MKLTNIVLIPGDGIGPEITVAVKRVLDAAGASITWIERQAGVSALASGADVLPSSTLEPFARIKSLSKDPAPHRLAKASLL